MLSVYLWGNLVSFLFMGPGSTQGQSCHVLVAQQQHLQVSQGQGVFVYVCVCVRCDDLAAPERFLNVRLVAGFSSGEMCVTTCPPSYPISLRQRYGKDQWSYPIVDS